MAEYQLIKGRWRGHSVNDTIPEAAKTFLSRREDTDTGIIHYWNGSAWINSAFINKTISVINPLTSNTTIDSSYDIVHANSSGGNFTITLPSAVGMIGKKFRFRKISTDYNYVIIDGAGSETIDELLTWELRLPYDFVEIISDNINWRLVDYTEFNLNSFRRKGTIEDRWYVAGMISGGNMSTGSLSVDFLNASPLIVSTPVTLNDIGVNVTVSSASAVYRFGVYRDKNNYPSTLILDAGQISGASTGLISVNINGGLKLQPGLYWLVLLAGVASTSIRNVANTQYVNLFGNSSSAAAAAPDIGLVHAFAYAALPTTFPNSSPSLSALQRPAIYTRFI